MGSTLTHNEAVEDDTNDVLEKYLHDIYEKECLYKIKEDEAEFIRTGIETVVKNIVDGIMDYLHGTDSVLKDESRIIKVGSIYEGTKNKYPNEFDFIFVYRSQTDSNIEDLKKTDLGFSKVYESIKTLLDLDKTYLQLSYCDGKREVYFEKRKMRHGPAEMLEFIYKSSSGKCSRIHVDLVPAIRIVSSKLDEIVCKNCTISPFRTEILSTGKCLVVDDEYTFTETEVHFIKNTLSQNHKKMYMILKYLVNGHDDNKILDRYLGAFTYIYSKGYTSYMIKTVVIRHHYECERFGIKELSPCVLTVLEDMCKYTHTDDFPRIVPSDKWLRSRKRRLVLRDRLKSMMGDLRSLQKSGECYDYERIGINGSAAKQFINTKWNVKLIDSPYSALHVLGARGHRTKIDPSSGALLGKKPKHG